MSVLTFQAASVDIKATKVPGGPSARITLYTGGLMRVEGLGLIVIDLAGMVIPETVPIVTDHNPSIPTTLGNGSPTIVDGQLIVAGTLTTVSPTAQHILALHKSGLPLQASVGAKSLAHVMVREGESVSVNGRSIIGPKGGFKLVTKSLLKEATICTLGADPETSVSIAASRVKGGTMNFDQYVTNLGFDPATLTPEQKAALEISFKAAYPDGGGTVTASQTEAEIDRVNAIALVCHGQYGEFPEIEANAVEQGWDMRRTRLEVIRARRPQVGPVLRHNHGSQDSHVIEASMLLSQGISEEFVGRHYDQRTINTAMDSRNRNVSIHGLINATLHAAGRSTGWRRVDSSVLSEALQAGRTIEASGFSTMSLPGALGNVAGKILLNTFESIATTWRLFCGITSASNFKPFASYDIMANGALEEIAQDGQLPHITMKETAFPNQVGIHGAFISLTEKMMVNDDLGVFAAIPRNFARMAATGLEKACYTTLMKNLATIFTAGRGNYIEGSDTALSIPALGKAERAFLDQVDVNGDPLLITPTLLGVPTSLSATSAVVCRDTAVQQPTSIDVPTSTGNPHASKFTPFVSPWLNNANMVGASNDHWFLFGTAPESGVITVAFLNGQQTPSVEKGDVDFSQLGVAWRVSYRFGVAVGDHRFGVRSKGAAA